MKVEFTHEFIKIYKKRFSHRPNIRKRFEERLRLFSDNSANPILKDHALGVKMLGKRAFSVTGDIRVVYYTHDETAYFVDIGTHNQVYGK